MGSRTQGCLGKEIADKLAKEAILESRTNALAILPNAKIGA